MSSLTTDALRETVKSLAEKYTETPLYQMRTVDRNLLGDYAQVGATPPPNGNPANERHYYDVSIIRVMNGWIVHVGCKRFVFNKWSDLSAELGAYYVAPKKAEEKWLH